MATGSGISGQFGIGEEVTWGTGVTVTRFYELISESIDYDIARIESPGIRSGQRIMRSEDWTPGTKKVSGSVDLELGTKNMALLFKHALGSVSTSGTNPYTHVLTPGDLTGKGLTVQVGRPDVSGTVQPFTFNGAKISGGTIGFRLGETGRLNLDLVAKDQTTGTALASAAYSASNNLLAYTHGAITVAGSSANVKSGSIKWTTPLASDRLYVGQSTTAEPLENARRDFTFDLACEFESLTAMNRFINGTEVALSVAFTRGADSVTFAGNVRFDKGTPRLSGYDILDQPLSGKFIATGADSTAFTATVVSSEATP